MPPLNPGSALFIPCAPVQYFAKSVVNRAQLTACGDLYAVWLALPLSIFTFGARQKEYGVKNAGWTLHPPVDTGTLAAAEQHCSQRKIQRPFSEVFTGDPLFLHCCFFWPSRHLVSMNQTRAPFLKRKCLSFESGSAGK